MRIELQEDYSDAVAQSLREGRADVGILVEGPELPGFDCTCVAQNQLVLLLPQAHRLASEEPILFADALDEDWISFVEGANLLKQQYLAAHSRGRLLRLRMQARSMDAVCHLVASGLGVAILPKSVAIPFARSNGLPWRPRADQWAERRVLVALRSGNQNKDVQSVAGFLQAAQGKAADAGPPARGAGQSVG